MLTKTRECEFHKGVAASENLSKSLLSPLWVCSGCYARYLDANVPDCKFCGIRVKSITDVRPFSQYTQAMHHTDCPRAGLFHDGEPVHPEENTDEH